MSQSHLTTLMRQARAFLEAREPAEAARILDQARMLARDDAEGLAEIYILQATSAVMCGRGDDAVALAHQALALDPGTESHLDCLVEECESRGQDEAANALRALGPGAQSARTAAQRNRFRTMVSGAFALAVVMGGLAYFNVLQIGESHRGAGRAVRLDFHRIKDNVGLVVVTAKYTFMDGHSITLPFGTGSCFAVAADGYLLTNKHVTSARDEAPEEQRKGQRLLAKRDWWKIKVCFGPDAKQQFDANLAACRTFGRVFFSDPW